MNRRAFTLLEVVLTVLIIGLIFGFVFPDLEKLLATRKLEESCEQMRSLLIMCRSRAMREGVKYRVQFPGTPDPLDKNAEREVDIPFETLQPEVFRQDRPLDFPDSFAKVEEDWAMQEFLKQGIRCVATFYGTNFDETPGMPVVGPAITEGKWEFVSLTFNPDGTCDHLTFRLTDLPFDIEPTRVVPTRVLDLIVDGRTGQTWFQRAFTIEEKEVMEEYGASPILHMDFNNPDPITEENILMINVDRQGVPTKRPSGGGAQE